MSFEIKSFTQVENTDLCNGIFQALRVLEKNVTRQTWEKQSIINRYEVK